MVVGEATDESSVVEGAGLDALAAAEDVWGIAVVEYELGMLCEFVLITKMSIVSVVLLMPNTVVMPDM